MVSDGRAPTHFDRDAYEVAHEEVVRLTTRLSHRSVRILAEEVVVRLSRRIGAAESPDSSPTDQEIRDLARALVDEDRAAWTRVLARPQASGASMRSIYVDYLAAAARQLGEWWNHDRMSFAEVTVGVGRIYAIMRSLRTSLPAVRPDRRFAVFATVPGETHTLGVTMAADLFRQRGWQVDLRVGIEHDPLVASLEDTDVHIIGISASASRFMADLIRLIVAIRITNPDVVVLVSGPIVDKQPDMVGITGADFATTDLDQALADLEQAWCDLSED